ncbi:MAG TPA: hypothetical protein VN688_06100 [Gemmataceae bacterium]|nr:hypothetical protein [Gemmataceae bacterium]
MRRRDFLGGVAASVCAGWTPSLLGQDKTPGKPLEIGLGPQLFLDDYLIDRLDGLTRRVQSPQRLEKPVLDSKTFGTTQPYLTVLPDSRQKGYRMWYNCGPAIWHAESEDGIRWADPRVAWDLPRGYGASLVDDGVRAANPRRRFKLANWQATRAKEDKVGDNSGMYVGFSPDGFHWTAYDKNPVLPSYPEGYPKVSRHGIGDIVDVYYDPLARRYAAAMKLHALPEDGYKAAPRAGHVFRRLVGMSTSKDFLHWEKPWRILVPDNKDDGLLEFYGMGGMHVRGRLRIGLARVLRDDLPCDAGGPKNGIGYAVLVTSRDGVTWTRYREPFLDRNPDKGSWDHAMTWMSGSLPVGDEVFFYYGGYARGHKIASKVERQIGLARMKKDRYVALVSAKETGTLRTRPFLVSGDRLTVNAKTAGGDIRVRLLDAGGEPLKDLGAAESRPIRGDVLAAEVRWPKPLAMLRGKPVRLEIRVRQAALFAVDFHAEAK